MVDGQTAFLTWDIFRKQEEILAQGGEVVDSESDETVQSDSVEPSPALVHERFGRYEVNSSDDD